MIKNSIQIDRNSNLLSVPSVEAPKANSEKKGICLSRQVRFISSAYFLCISFSLSVFNCPYICCCKQHLFPLTEESSRDNAGNIVLSIEIRRFLPQNMIKNCLVGGGEEHESLIL